MMNLSNKKKTFLGAAIGTMIEYYDYVLFITFLPILSPIFFPGNSAYESLIKGYFILLIAMLARPLGGLFFGYFGDILGRRKALLGSMYGIALSTLIIGITPAFDVIGIWAMIIITVAKALQLFCFGGEYNGAGIYVVEHAQNRNEALAGSLLTAMTLFGSLLASLIGVILTIQGMPTWSWRIAFILGGFVGIFGIIYRKNLLESPNFKQADLKVHGLFKMLRRYPQAHLAGFFIGGYATVPFTTVLGFINPVLVTKGVLTTNHFMLLQTLLTLVAVIVLLLVGFIADKKTPVKVMRFSCWALVLFSYPLLSIIDQGNFLWIVIAEIAFVIINEIFLGPSNAYLKNLFIMEYRYRGTSLSFCLGMSLLGGLTPIIENYLYRWDSQFSYIAFWLVFIGLGAYFSLFAKVQKQVAFQKSLKTSHF